MLPYTVTARDKVMQHINADDIDRLAVAAVNAAERSSRWTIDEQYFYEIEEQKYSVEGAEHSGFAVQHCRICYELNFYYAVMAETIVDGPQSWEA